MGGILPTFDVNWISSHVVRIMTACGDCVYLVVGAKRAFLLDAGFGIGDLKAEVERASRGLPITLLLTHGHFDHIGGAGQFEDVRISQRDISVARRDAPIGVRADFISYSYAEAIDKQTVGNLPFRETCVNGWTAIEDDEVFDAGGVHVRMISVPGHTRGSLVPVVVEDRIAVFGDACGENTLLIFAESTTVETYRSGLLRLKAHEDSWDVVVRNHGTHQSPKGILDRNIELCTRVLRGEDDCCPIQIMGKSACAASSERGLEMHGNVIYNPDRIF